MALVLKDRVQETTTTTGQGTITLAGAVAGFQSFATIGNGNTTYYTIVGGTQWEMGIGTYTSSGTTLSRDTVISNSLGDTTKIDFAAGTKNVFVTYPAEKSVYVDGTSIIPGNTATVAIAQGGTGSSTATFSGANITSLNADAISSGTIANARTTAASTNGASTIVARDASGNFTGYNVSATNFIGTLNGSGANVSSINASNISSGTIANARTTATDANGASTIVARDASGNFTGYNVSATNFIGTLNGSGANVSSINASNISSGTIANARTTATDANGASTIVARDASGNFTGYNVSATNFIGTLNGSGANVTSINASNISAGTLGVARGGTGATTLNANAVIIGNTTGAVTFVAPGTSGNVLTSNGTVWASSAPGGGGYIGGQGQVFTSSGTFTVPTGVTAVKVTVVGGGGNGGSAAGTNVFGCSGGGGGVAIKYVTGLTPGGTVSVTVGTAGNTSSFGAYCSATGGSTGSSNTAQNAATVGGAGGAGSSGDINLTGGTGGYTGYLYAGAGGGAGAGGYASGTLGDPTINTSPGPIIISSGQNGLAGGTGGAAKYAGGINTPSAPGTGYGNGAGGCFRSNATQTGGAGSSGIVIVEW